MCLSVPAKVLEINRSQWRARVDYLGSHIVVGIALLEKVVPGQYVLVHAGEAIQVIDEVLAQESIELWKRWL
jgi:hydrogenase expression/formation protein HypC